jgi:hypothetical protein
MPWAKPLWERLKGEKSRVQNSSHAKLCWGLSPGFQPSCVQGSWACPHPRRRRPGPWHEPDRGRSRCRRAEAKRARTFKSESTVSGSVVGSCTCVVLCVCGGTRPGWVHTIGQALALPRSLCGASARVNISYAPEIAGAQSVGRGRAKGRETPPGWRVQSNGAPGSARMAAVPLHRGSRRARRPRIPEVPGSGGVGPARTAPSAPHNPKTPLRAREAKAAHEVGANDKQGAALNRMVSGVPKGPGLCGLWRNSRLAGGQCSLLG